MTTIHCGPVEWARFHRMMQATPLRRDALGCYWVPYYIDRLELPSTSGFWKVGRPSLLSFSVAYVALDLSE